MYSLRNVMGDKIEGMRWAGHVKSVGEGVFLVSNPQEKGLL